MLGTWQFGALGLTGTAGILLALGIPFSGASICGYTLAGLSAASALGKMAARRAVFRQQVAPSPVEESPVPAESVPEPPTKPVDFSDEQSLVNHMLAQDRYAILLRPQVAGTLSKAHIERALDELDAQMSMIPEGDVVLRAWRFEREDIAEEDLGTERIVFVDALFLDRYPITNRQYFDFVASGGYELPALWDAEVLSGVVEFVDRSGNPGPRYWENGHYPVDEDDLPVVGVSWYEAMAYARWAGKRLPSDAEWVKAASWPIAQPDAKPTQRRFPWGAAMDRGMANLWGSGPGCPVSVQDYPQGASVGGAGQMIGNVWEWTNSSFGTWSSRLHVLELPMPMKSIRGGAYDTYFDNHAQNNFQSGDGLLARKHNIGFRCAVGICDVISNLIPNVTELADDDDDDVSFADEAFDIDRNSDRTVQEEEIRS